MKQVLVNKANNTTVAFMDPFMPGYKPMFIFWHYMKANIDLSVLMSPSKCFVGSLYQLHTSSNTKYEYFPSIPMWRFGNTLIITTELTATSWWLVHWITTSQLSKFLPSQSTNTPSTPAKTQYATFSGVYVADYWTRYNNKMYGVNFDMSIKPIDYNNYIPISAMTLTDKYGNKLVTSISRNNGRMEYFTWTGGQWLVKTTT